MKLAVYNQYVLSHLLDSIHILLSIYLISGIMVVNTWKRGCCAIWWVFAVASRQTFLVTKLGCTSATVFEWTIAMTLQCMAVMRFACIDSGRIWVRILVRGNSAYIVVNVHSCYSYPSTCGLPG